MRPLREPAAPHPRPRVLTSPPQPIFLLAIALGCLVGLVPSGLAQQTTSEPTAVERASNDLRRLGTVVLAWWIEQAGEATFAAQEAAEARLVDVTARPLVPHRDLLERLDMSRHELPLDDPWGRPYEVRLRLPDEQEIGGVTLRSAGADREFETDTYSLGPAGSDPAADLVWADGFFVRWPHSAAFESSRR